MKESPKVKSPFFGLGIVILCLLMRSAIYLKLLASFNTLRVFYVYYSAAPMTSPQQSNRLGLFQCDICHQVCKSAGGLTRHSNALHSHHPDLGKVSGNIYQKHHPHLDGALQSVLGLFTYDIFQQLDHVTKMAIFFRLVHQCHPLSQNQVTTGLHSNLESNSKLPSSYLLRRRCQLVM